MDTTIKQDSDPNPTLDQLQEFIDQCRALGMPGSTKTNQIGTSTGYHFTGTYQFKPNGKIRASYKPPKNRKAAIAHD